MRRHVNLSAAIIGIAVAVMTVAVIGVLLYVLLENQKKVAAECVHDFTKGFLGVDLSDEEKASLII